jgi:ribosome-associated protein
MKECQSAESDSTPDKKHHLRTRCQCSTLGAGEHHTTLSSRSLNASLSIAPNPRPEPEIPNWLMAVRSAESKKAENLKILDLREATSFTDFFVICTATNPRQGQAICSSIEKELKDMGELPYSIEGYDPAEWILMDYGDFLVHIFSSAARGYYDLERLWRHAKTINSRDGKPDKPAAKAAEPAEAITD